MTKRRDPVLPLGPECHDAVAPENGSDALHALVRLLARQAVREALAASELSSLLEHRDA